MNPALDRRQAALLVVAGLVVVSGLAAVASPANDRQDAPRQSITAGTPPTTQVDPAATNVTPPIPPPAWRMGKGNAVKTNSIDTTGPTSPLTSRWAFETEDGGVSKGPLVANGKVYFGFNNGNGDERVYAVDASTGKKRWQFTTGSQNWIAALAVFRDTVYVGTNTGRVYAFDAATGERFWTVSPGDDINSLTVANRTLYVASDNLYALDALTGKKRWLFDTEQSDTHAGPVVKDGSVYVGSSGHFYAVDAQTGAERWTFNKVGFFYPGPSVANGLVYVVDRIASRNNDNTLYTLDAETGEQQWTFDPVGGVRGPEVANDTLYAGVNGNGLYALDAHSGTERWHVREFTRTPNVVDNAAYVEKAGSIYSLDPSTGAVHGRFTPPVELRKKKGGIRGKAVVNGSLYTGVSAKNPGRVVVYAVGTPEFTYSDLSVTQQSPGVNESVKVTVAVRNKGTGSGTFNATLVVDGTISNATTGELDPRKSRTVTFTHTFQENGTYTVRVSGLTRRIDVGDVTPPPTPTPTATTTQASQTGTQQSETTPTAPSTTATPTSSTVPGFGVGVVVAAVPVVIGLLARRRWP